MKAKNQYGKEAKSNLKHSAENDLHMLKPKKQIRRELQNIENSEKCVA